MTRDHTTRAPRIGIGGPVGSGKTALVAALCRALGPDLRLGVVTNDIYTTEDADFLRRAGVLDDTRIAAVRTGCCPHTAIRGPYGTRLTTLRSEAPLLLRPTPDALYLVSGAGGPLGGDDLTLALTVRTGAALTVRTTAATGPAVLQGHRAVGTVLAVGTGAVRDDEPPAPTAATMRLAGSPDAVLRTALAQSVADLGILGQIPQSRRATRVTSSSFADCPAASSG